MTSPSGGGGGWVLYAAATIATATAIGDRRSIVVSVPDWRDCSRRERLAPHGIFTDASRPSIRPVRTLLLTLALAVAEQRDSWARTWAFFERTLR
ncbi:MAG: hypothetical protein H0W68_05650 [Gemmatimonadaceae bacterium]|nr:hypothetical protein [Gemmatimonadaceae bacterium]